MKREIRTSEKLLLFGFSAILVFMLVHDWVPLGSLNDIHAVQSENTFNELLSITLINASQFIVLLGLLLTFIGKKYPIWAKIWLIVHPASILVGAVSAWWFPYLTGFGVAERVERYQQMFGNTHSFLPIMNGIVPNTLHVLFHITFLFCVILAIYLAFSSRKRNSN